MKKKFLSIGFLLAVILGVFLFGPSIGQCLYRWITPEATLETWRKEYRDLDAIFPRTATQESKRLNILRKLAQRGIHIDPGIRDEAIEHNISPYTIVVATFWRWEEFLGIP